MAIKSELIGSLNTPGFGFRSTAPATYALPKYPYGATVTIVRWATSGTMSFDILDRETGNAVLERSTTSYAGFYASNSNGWDETAKKGALLRINSSTEMYVFVIPNTMQAPPIWNG